MIKDKCFWLLASIVFVSLFLFLGASYFNTKREPREAVVALSMLQQGNWILPINNAVDIPYKPPLFHWCIALGSMLTGGVSEYTSRFPSAVALAVMVLAGYVFFARRRGWNVAFVMALLTLSNFELHRAGTNCRVDMLLSALMVLALYQLYKWGEKGLRGIPWTGILCLSGAFLTKGPVGVVLPCLVTAVFLWMRGWNFWNICYSFLWVGLVSCVLPFLWYWAAYQQGGERFLQLVLEENIWRFMGKMSYESHENPAYYNVLTIMAGFLPYTLLALLSLFTLKYKKIRYPISSCWTRFKQYISQMDDVRLFSLVCIVIIFVFYCIPKSKRSVYLIPVYPFIAYFLAEYMLYAWRFRPMLLKAFGHMMAVLVWGLLALFAIVRLGGISDAVFAGHHATENIAFLYAMKTVPIGIVGLLLLTGIIVTTSTYFLLCRRGKFLHWGLYGIFAVIFSLYMALDGMFVPIILNVKSDKPVAQYIAEVVPEGKLYSCYTNQVTGNPMRQFSINFYLGDRVVPFEGERPTEGYLVAGEEDAAIFKEKHNGYRLELVYDSGHRSCDDHKIVCLYYFRKMER